MVDPRRVRSLLARLRERRGLLETYGRQDRDAFLAHAEGVLAAKYLLLTAIEDALAIGSHIVASETFRSPADYADVFRVLVEEEIVDSALGERLEAMARFRNLLVHEYGRISDERVHEILVSRLDDLDAYAARVLSAFPDL